MGDDDRQLKYINVGMEFTNKVTKKILENLDEDEKEEQLEIMRSIMKNYIKMEHEYKVSKDVLAKIKKGLEVGSVDLEQDIEADYRTHYQNDLAREALTDDKLESDHRYRQLQTIIGGANGDDDLVVTGDDQVFIDPWTRRNIEDPVTNKKCGHTYEKAGVFRLIDKMVKQKKTLRCPNVGCGNNNVTKNDLHVDNDIKRKIMRQNRSK